MSELVLFLYMLAVLAIAIAQPVIGVSIYVWLATFYPEGGNTGILAWPWALITVCIVPLGILFNRKARFSLNTPVFWFMIVFYLWTCVTYFHALFPDYAAERWWVVTRCIIAFTLLVGVLSNRRDANVLAWTLVAGAGAMAVGGLAQVVLSGGHGSIVGIQGSAYGGNNEFARLLGISGLPYSLFYSFHARGRSMRTVCRFLAVACTIAILGTFSRGAFVALAAMVAYWFMISRWRLRLAVLMGVTAILLAIFLTGTSRQAFINRIQSIETRDTDQSYQGRVFAWNYATNLAHERPIFGGGYYAFRGAMIAEGHSGPQWKDAHSIYYEALGEHGYVGLGLYLFMLGFAFLRARSLQKQFARDPRYYWERDLAIAAQLSMVFFLVAGITGSLTYSESLLFTLAIIAVLDKINRTRINELGSEMSKNSADWRTVRVENESAFRTTTRLNHLGHEDADG